MIKRSRESISRVVAAVEKNLPKLRSVDVDTNYLAEEATALADEATKLAALLRKEEAPA